MFSIVQNNLSIYWFSIPLIVLESPPGKQQNTNEILKVIPESNSVWTWYGLKFICRTELIQKRFK